MPGWGHPCPCRGPPGRSGWLWAGARPGEAAGTAQADKPGYLRLLANALSVPDAD